MAIFIVERGSGNAVEIEADRAEQDAASSRVTFLKNGATADAKPRQVGSFINVQAWYEKPPEG